MNDLYFNKEFDFLELEVSEKIENKNLKKFIITSLKLHNKNLSKKDKIYLTFIQQLNQYQIYVLKFPYKSFEFLAFDILYERDIVKNSYDLFVCEQFFCLYRNGKFFYLQNIKLDTNLKDVVLFLNNKFNIEINDFRIISKEELNEIKQKYKKNNQVINLENLNLNNNLSFKFYLYYLFILSSIFFFIIFFYQNKEVQEDKNKSFSFEEIKKEYAFKSFQEEIEVLFKSIKKYDLSINSSEFKGNETKIVLNSSSKNNIYLFLQENKNFIVNTAVNYFEDKNIYEATINVQISK